MKIALVLLFSITSIYAQTGVRKDVDQDYYSYSYGATRGANWRGYDCDDQDSSIRSGRYEEASSVYDNIEDYKDYNCNIIKAPWEFELCNDSKAMGIVTFGDSISGGYQAFLNTLSTIKDIIYSGAKKTLETKEFYNFPEISWSTGLDQRIRGRSVYLKMVDRNQCNYNDYQNLSNNGATSAMFSQQVDHLVREKADKPVLAFVTYSGNDVCDLEFSRLKTPEKFKENIIKGLDKLNQKVPAGSKVILMGVAQVGHWYEVLAHRKYKGKFGDLFKIKTYADLYAYKLPGGAYLNSCRTALDPSPTARAKVDARAGMYSNVMKEITVTKHYENLELGYIDFPMEMFENYRNQGKDEALLIDPLDGFHISKLGHREMFYIIWEKLQTQFPDFIGPVNQNNQLIRKYFFYHEAKPSRRSPNK